MKRCRCGGPGETPDSNGIVRARIALLRPRREHEARHDHRRGDHESEEPVDRERQPVVEQATLLRADRRFGRYHGVTVLGCVVGTLRAMATIETDRAAVVALTERAAEKVAALMAQEPAGEAEVLRVAIQGGGCGGFEYALGFDRGATDEDTEFEFYGVKVVVDPGERAVPDGRDGRLRRVAEGVRVQGRQPERRRARAAAATASTSPTTSGERGRLRALSRAARCSSSERLRVAVVGSGPAGFYTAAPLLAAGAAGRPDRAAADAVGPRPPRRRARPSRDQGGLARVREDRAKEPGFRFFGNVEVGQRRQPRRARARSTTPSSTRSARRPTGGSGSPARTCPARGPRPSSSPGTTAIPTSSTTSSTSPASARSWSGTGTSPSTSRGCSR